MIKVSLFQKWKISLTFKNSISDATKMVTENRLAVAWVLGEGVSGRRGSVQSNTEKHRPLTVTPDPSYHSFPPEQDTAEPLILNLVLPHTISMCCKSSL